MSDSLPPMTDTELAAIEAQWADYRASRVERTAFGAEMVPVDVDLLDHKLTKVFAEVKRLRRENDLLTIQLRNSKQCALRELEAQIRGDEAEAERDAARSECAALAAKVGELEAQIEAGRRVEKGEPCPECGGTVSPWRDVRGKVGFHACTTCTWPLPGPDGKWRTASGMPHAPAQEAQERPETPDGDSGTGTDVREAHGRSEASEWPDVDGWSVRLVGGEVVVRRDNDERQLSGWDIPVGAVLAFIADQEPEEDDEEPDLSLIPAGLIKSDPGIRGGEPCITGTRIPAHEVAGYLADGATWDEVREMLPSLPSLPVPSTERPNDER